jgi:hypothetical protein
MAFEVYCTRFDDPHPIEQIPARNLEMTFPLSDHGECAFSATVEPRKSFWRPAVSSAVSGVLVCSDGQPVWSGQIISEQQSGPRTFDFTCAEWGSFFEGCPSEPLEVTNTNDHDLFRRVIADAQAISGQDAQIILGATVGASGSDLTINAWDSTTVEEEFRRIGEHAGGPEWYFATTGTLDNPTRTLVLGDRLGSTIPMAVLEYVEDTEAFIPLGPPPTDSDFWRDTWSDIWPGPLTSLGLTFPGAQPYAVLGGSHRRGGNVIAQPARQQTPGITVATAVGAGDQAAQMRTSASADVLLAAGYPRKTKVTQYTDVSIPATLQRHADGDLAAGSGMTTSYTLSTFGSNPDWTSISRGDTIRVELDTDVYATSDRPLVFESRVLEIAVKVPDDGPVEVNYVIADTRI